EPGISGGPGGKSQTVGVRQSTLGAFHRSLRATLRVIARTTRSGVMLHSELATVFQLLEEAGIRWCVLRMPPEPGKTGGDVDLLVDTADSSRLQPVLSRRGFVELRGWPGGQHFLNYDRPTDRWLWLHFVTE